MPSKASVNKIGNIIRKIQKHEVQSIDSERFAYFMEDWSTQGDWVGRYGRQANVLCAMASPYDHRLYWDLQTYKISGQLGPHIQNNDELRRWVHWVETSNPKCLYNPVAGTRREAEWDDHGEVYPLTFDGPDMWVRIELPQGIHQISLYFVNKDGHVPICACRDFDISVYAGALIKGSNAIARTRVSNFWGGVYKSLIINGPGPIRIKLGRNYSLDTICSGIFIDRLTGTSTHFDDLPMPWMGGVFYKPLQVPENEQTRVWVLVSDAVDDAREIWKYANLHPFFQGGKPIQIQTYRTIVADSTAPAPLLDRWRWKLKFWKPTDRRQFNNIMKQAYAKQLLLTPSLAVR
jgi:hypothetical protein